MKNPHLPPTSGIDYHLSDHYRAAQEAFLNPPTEQAGQPVWHVTHRKNMSSIAENGLLPHRIRRPSLEDLDEHSRAWPEATAWLDELRPANLGVSIQNSVFAQPLGGHILDLPQKHSVYANSSSTPSSRTDAHKDMLEFSVDPETAFVVPGTIGEAARRAKIAGSKDAEGLGLAYWKNAMSLKQFLELYEQHETDEPVPAPFFVENLVTNAVVWRLKDQSSADEEQGLPAEYDIAPEVLVPPDASGGIAPDRLRHMASSLIHMYKI